MLEYDLRRLLEHPLRFREFIPAAIHVFGGQTTGRFKVRVRWKRSGSPNVEAQEETLVLCWDVDTLKSELPRLEDDLAILRDRDEDQATRTEMAAVVVAVAVMSLFEPATQFTRRSATGTSHDYYLNESRDEMIEIAGRQFGGLPALFAEKRTQSDRNPMLRKRWDSVTIFEKSARNRTEGLHP